jgi:hypothetical protein
LGRLVADRQRGRLARAAGILPLLDIEAELSRLLDIFSLARRNAFRVVESTTDGRRRIVGTFGIECHNSTLVW